MDSLPEWVKPFFSVDDFLEVEIPEYTFGVTRRIIPYAASDDDSDVGRLPDGVSDDASSYSCIQSGSSAVAGDTNDHSVRLVAAGSSCDKVESFAIAESSDGSRLNEETGCSELADTRKESQATILPESKRPSPPSSPSSGEYHHFVYDTLVQSGLLCTFRVFRSKHKPHQMLLFIKTGRRVCGHKGVVHGGLTATLIDNAFGQAAGMVFDKVATKSLEIIYLKPLLVDTDALLHVCVQDIRGSSCRLQGDVYTSRHPHIFAGYAENVPECERKERCIVSLQGNNVKGGCLVATASGIMVDVSRKWVSP